MNYANIEMMRHWDPRHEVTETVKKIPTVILNAAKGLNFKSDSSPPDLSGSGS
jgi:hypothetical protein